MFVFVLLTQLCGFLMWLPERAEVMPWRPRETRATAARRVFTSVDMEVYELDRSTLEAMIGDPNRLAAGSRIVPVVRDGHADGWKLYNVRPSGLQSLIGFRMGDVVKTINGYDLTTPDNALTVYTKLRNVTSFTIELDRGGRTRTLIVHIVG